MGARDLAGWMARRSLVALSFYAAAVQTDLLLPFVGVPWRGPRWIIGCLAGLAAAWLAAWLTGRLARSRRRERERVRVERLGLQALARALR